MPSSPTDAPGAQHAHDASTVETSTISVVCAWCGRPLGRGSVNPRRVSHGICRPCSDDLLYSDAPELLVRR